MGSQSHFFFENHEVNIVDDVCNFDDGQDWDPGLSRSRKTTLNVQVRKPMNLYTTTLSCEVELESKFTHARQIFFNLESVMLSFTKKYLPINNESN